VDGPASEYPSTPDSNPTADPVQPRQPPNRLYYSRTGLTRTPPSDGFQSKSDTLFYLETPMT
ncbi:MAG: hypothetical protein ACKOAU_01580, partial [Pirellula sp.]